MATYYEYVHRAGYGRDDHMADEIIARAARHLGMDTDGYLAQAVGLASHAVPMDRARVRLRAERGVRARMQRALRDARREVLSRDTLIEIVCVRTVYEGDWRVREERRGRQWIAVARDSHEVTA